ncbi:MAG: AsmA family protein, partial [Bacteroidales bacterium]|nr:AsmA family protein [Bacteroidales bacterium]
MKKLLKILCFSVVGFLLLLIVIPMFFKDKVLKAVTEVAKEFVDADVVIGDLDISLISNFPGCTVSLDDVSVVGHNEFAGDTLVAFDDLDVTVNVMSLFGGTIKVKSIELDNPRANVIVTKAGIPNYDIVISDSTAVEEEAPEEESEGGFSLKLKKLQVNNLCLNYTDSVTDVHALIENLNFGLRGDLSDKETILNALMDIAKLNVRMGQIIYINDAVVNLKSDLDADLQNMKFTFQENLFQINELALALDGWVCVPDTNVQMDLKFGTKSTDFLSVISMIPAEYAKDLEGVKTSGKFAFEGGAKGDFNAVSFPEFWVDFVVDNARFQYPDLPKSAENINVDAHVYCPGNLDSINIDVEKFHVELGNNPVDAKVVVQTSAKDISLDGKVDLNLDLDIVKDVVPLDDMTISGLVKAGLSFAGNLSDIDNERYDRFNANGDITLTKFRTVMEDLPPVDIHKAHLIISPKAGNLEYLDMNLGKSDFALNGTLDNIFQYVFADSTLKASFNFNSNLIDVNDIYSYDHSQPVAEVPAEGEEAPTEAPEIPTNIDFALNTNIGKILYDSLVIDNLSGKIGLRNGVASLNNLKLNMLGGSAFCSGLYDGSNIMNPKVDLQLDLSEISVQTTANTFNTVEKLAPIAKSVYGNVTAKVNFKSEMDHYLNPIYNTVNGDGRLITNEIQIRDSKVFQMISAASKNPSMENPKMKNLNIGFQIVDGNVMIDSTAFRLNDQDGSFMGTVGLDESLDMKVGMKLSGTAANSLLSKAVGDDKSSLITVFANIGGTVSNPKITGFSTSATDAIKQVVEEKVAQVKAELSENAKKYIA